MICIGFHIRFDSVVVSFLTLCLDGGSSPPISTTTKQQDL
nr:MAG TPA: hypothetical protein [Caudoviricetes sp.]